MNIHELSPSASLSILAVSGRKSVEVPVRITELSEEEDLEVKAKVQSLFVPLQVITRQVNKKLAIISFQAIRADLSMLAIQGADIYRWDNVNVDMIPLSSGKKIHVVKLKTEEGKRFNRRKGVRLDIDTRMYIEQNGFKNSVVVKDVSYCGFSFLEKGKNTVDLEKTVTLHLIDSSGKMFGYIAGQIVRHKEYENGDVFYGCKVPEDFQQLLQKYIAIQQMERARGHKVADITRNENHDKWRESIAYEFAKTLKNQ